MDIKTYLKRNKLKISDISRQAGVPYTTVNEIMNGKTDIDRVQIGTGLRIAEACRMDFMKFYDLCKKSNSIPAVSGGRILKKNKSYYLQCSLPEYDGEIYLCKVNPVNTQFIRIWLTGPSVLLSRKLHSKKASKRSKHGQTILSDEKE